uniref:Uncharacterized protein n=1 Tax=viral metagenome TaxID=1070528 RepID=A0A6M3Y4G8_9ZZZZ
MGELFEPELEEKGRVSRQMVLGWIPEDRLIRRMDKDIKRKNWRDGWVIYRCFCGKWTGYCMRGIICDDCDTEVVSGDRFLKSIREAEDSKK